MDKMISLTVEFLEIIVAMDRAASSVSKLLPNHSARSDG